MDDEVDRPEPPSAKAVTALLREARSLSRRADKLSGTAAAVDDPTTQQLAAEACTSIEQLVHHLMGKMLRNRLVLRYRPGAPERVAKNGGFGGQGDRIVAGLRMPFRPSGNHVRHIVDETMDTTILMMPVRRTFGDDKQVALVRHTQCPFERPEDHLIDIGVGVGMFVDQQTLGSSLVRACQCKMT